MDNETDTIITKHNNQLQTTDEEIIYKNNKQVIERVQYLPNGNKVIFT